MTKRTTKKAKAKQHVDPFSTEVFVQGRQLHALQRAVEALSRQIQGIREDHDMRVPRIDALGTSVGNLRNDLMEVRRDHDTCHGDLVHILESLWQHVDVMRGVAEQNATALATLAATVAHIQGSARMMGGRLGTVVSAVPPVEKPQATPPPPPPPPTPPASPDREAPPTPPLPDPKRVQAAMIRYSRRVRARDVLQDDAES